MGWGDDYEANDNHYNWTNRDDTHLSMDRNDSGKIFCMGMGMKERLEAALRYEQAMILYEEGKISYPEIYILWLAHAKFICDELAEEVAREFVREYKIGLI